MKKNKWLTIIAGVMVLAGVGYLAYTLYFPPTGPATLPIVALNPTSDGASPSGETSYQYPANIVIEDVGKYSNQISAYGGANQIWIGPKGWTGSAAEGADGNTSVNLYPSGDSTASGPYVSYTEIPACIGCMLSAAAPYFPDAMVEYNATFHTTPITMPEGLTVTQLSPTLVMYSYPVKAALLEEGASYYSPGSQSSYSTYWEADVRLPPEQKGLSDFLLQTFIARENLK